MNEYEWGKIVLIFVLGASIGSFLHAMVWRIQNNFPIILSRSRCEKCGVELKWYELIPLISYWICRAKCAKCKQKLSISLFLVEVVTGLVFVGLYYHHFYNLGCVDFREMCGTAFWLQLFFFCGLFALFLSDLWYQTLPDSLTITLIAILLLLNLFAHINPLGEVLIGAAIGGGVFLFQWLISKGKWIGSGDIILGVILGLLLGIKVIGAIAAAYIFGAIVAIFLLVFGKKKKGDTMPLGVFLTFFGLVFFMFGDRIVEWFIK